MLRENSEYFNWRKWTGREGEDPPSDKELREKKKAEADKLAAEERSKELDIQHGNMSKSAAEALDAVND